ncbi:MAG: radical SAM protein [Candidatus Aminicenantes bacterium]|nr:radical SAM protein [Candidatus Aminicenantes bacterium]
MSSLTVMRTVMANPKLLLVRPAINKFMIDYLRKFKMVQVGGNIILHSHLPPLNSKAYKRFVDRHLLKRVTGPSHAQVGLTNVCPQNCEYCYNKGRKGIPMDTSVIKEVIRDLKELGVVWLGFTGGEPLCNQDIVEITETAGDDIALKLFTTGCTLTEEKASDLRNAGLFSVSVSLDHWKPEEHDRFRRYEGAFRTALRALDIFKNLGDVHVGVSAVLSKEMIVQEQVEEFLDFLIGLEIHEAWLSEAKPSVAAYWNKDMLITLEEQNKLIALQDRCNKEGKITVNYLGHFESGAHFGCNAGHKMIYVDAFGEVSPCVFTPMTFGNVRDEPVKNIVGAMKNCFRSSDSCFINTNFELFRKYVRGNLDLELDKEASSVIAGKARFGGLPEFFRIYEK